MAKMKSSLAFILFLIDLLGGIVLLILSSIIMATQTTEVRSSQTEKISNLRGSNLNNLNEIHPQIKSYEKTKERNLSNLDGDEFVLFNKQESSLSSPKRKLENSSEKKIDNRIMIVFFLNLLSLHFVFAIGFSFMVDQNECCRHFNDNFCLVFLMCIFNFTITYFSVKACGKHISRYIGLSFVTLISITNFILTSFFISSPQYKLGLMVSILVITGLMSIINFIGILLPNLICCPSLRYDPSQRPMVSIKSQPLVSPSSDFSNVPTYPPNNSENPSGYPTSGYVSSQENIYANPQPQPISLQSV